VTRRQLTHVVTSTSVCLSVTMAAFFKSFRKGFVVCRSLDTNLSGKVAKKNDSDTEKRLPRPQCVSPLAIAAYEICHGVTEHG